VVFDDVRVDFYIPVGHVRGSRIKMNLPQVELAGLSVQGENISGQIMLKVDVESRFW